MTSCKLAVDFDSLTTNIYRLGSGMVLSEPTVAAVSDDDKSSVKAIGLDAKKLIGKTSKSTKTVFPVFEGEIVNVKVAGGILNGFLKKIEASGGLSGIEAIFSLPCGYSVEMAEKYAAVAKNCGIRKIWFAESPFLSALGQRIPMNDATPCFIIDMAGGTTGISALTLDGIIAGVSVNFGANKVSTDIIDYIADTYGLQIGLLTAERIKKEIASLEDFDGLATVVNGRDLSTGTPRAVSIKAMNIIDCVKKYYDKIAEIAMTLLTKLPPEVSAEIRHSGIYVSGCASEVYGLSKYYENKFDMPVKVNDNGAFSVALGGGIALGDSKLLKKVAICYR